jgi:hypothetical protein
MAEGYLKEGNFYLFSCPWDWTFVGEYVRHCSGGQEIVIRNGGYFTRTGATFDRLCKVGFQSDTKFHPTADGEEQSIPAQGPKWPWRAPTSWVKEKGGAK